MIRNRHTAERRAKGAITVFMVIAYIWVFILMGVLVDGARIRMAQAQAEEIQQIANETMLTYYNRALYEYYDLFGETYLPVESMGSMIQDIMQQSMSVELNGDLKQAMQSKWFFSMDGQTYFDPYDLTVDEIQLGSSINLLDKDVFISQVNDAMKYSAPLILVNNVANLVDSFGAASDGIKAVEECNDTVSDIQDDIEAYQDSVEELRNKLYHFAEEPDQPLRSSSKDGATVADVSEFTAQFDNEAHRAMGGLINQILALPEDEGESEDIDYKLDSAFQDYISQMNKIRSNGRELYQDVQQVIRNGEQLKSSIAAKRSSLATKGADQSNAEVGQIYRDFSDTLQTTEDAVNQYSETLQSISIYVNVVQNGNLVSWSSYQQAAQKVLEQLKETHDANSHKMAEDPTVTQFTDTLNTQLKNISGEAAGLNRVEIDDSKLKEAEEKVKQANQSGEKQPVDDTDRLGWVTTIHESSASEASTEVEHITYDRDNAEKTAEKLGDTASGLMDVMGQAGGKLMDNLYSNAYIMTNFRDYVHTYKMLNSDGSNNSDKDGYDTVSNIKFLEGEKDLLTQKQFQQVETTCAEIEYVIYGMQDTKLCVAASYATIYGYRLALNYASVFLTSTYRQAVMETAAAAGTFAPLVIALMPLAWAIPQTVQDMTMIMQGMTTPLIRTNEKTDWFKTSYANATTYLAGYSDYLLIQLLMMNSDKKTERMQDIVQMNMQTIDANFTLEKAVVNVYVHSSCSVRYLFMTQAFMPRGVRMDGRYSFDLKTSVSY